MLQEIWKVLLLLAFVPGGTLFAAYRVYRCHKKHWCPKCRRWYAHVFHERERPNNEMAFSHWRVCQTVKECSRCGHEEVLREPYLKKFSEWQLRRGEHREDIRNL